MMSVPEDLPAWAAILTSILVLTGAALTLIGTIGLLRLKNFYTRVHPPTLGTTLGIGCVLLASM
ncbi:MAG TPA: monovalent cation/H(+) antiporter subunit G, partial [Hyphomicrobium sp.]|nr:monovalent cation/H(+) antiporter subunit G [Hyphomicrobium sp.]